MNNKHLGAQFEREICEYLKSSGWWVHFIAPAPNGAQPFDIVAVKDGHALAADCKTTVTKRFPLSRLEQNQIMAFDRWIACGNDMPVIFVKYGSRVYKIFYGNLKTMEVIDLEEYKPLFTL